MKDIERLFTRVCHARQGATGLNCNRPGLGWTQRRNVLDWRWWGAGTGCPKKLWLCHPWKRPRSGWTQLGAAWKVSRPMAEGGTGWSVKNLSNPHSSVIWQNRDSASSRNYGTSIAPTSQALPLTQPLTDLQISRLSPAKGFFVRWEVAAFNWNCSHWFPLVLLSIAKGIWKVHP